MKPTRPPPPHETQNIIPPTAPPPTDLPRRFPPFSLSRLLRTVFDPKPGERVCVLIDLEDPRQVEGYRFLQNPDLSIQRHAHDVIYQGLRNGVIYELGLKGGEMFAYEITGGHQLYPPPKRWATERRGHALPHGGY